MSDFSYPEDAIRAFVDGGHRMRAERDAAQVEVDRLTAEVHIAKEAISSLITLLGEKARMEIERDEARAIVTRVMERSCGGCKCRNVKSNGYCTVIQGEVGQNFCCNQWESQMPKDEVA